MVQMNEIAELLQKGKAKDVVNLVNQAVAEGVSAETILKEGLLAGMEVVGRRFRDNEIFVPEVLVAARAMNKGAEVLRPLLAQEGLKAAGADGIIMAEPLAGILSPDMAEEFSCPYVKEIIDDAQSEEFAVVYHNCGNTVPQMAHYLYAMGAAAYHFGNAIDMQQMMQSAPKEVVLMGNLDPVSCFTERSAEHMKEETLALLEKCGGYQNFILSSGCDIPHNASWDNIQAFFEALEEYNQEV